MDYLFKIHLLLAIFLASLPLVLWMDSLGYIKKHDPEVKKYLKFVFLLGCLTTLPTLLIQYLWVQITHKTIDVSIVTSISSQSLATLLSIVIFVIFEEVGKISVLAFINRFIYKIRTINQAVMFGMFIALGFSFIENITYFFDAVTNGNIVDLFFIFSFRSIFTICAHLIFTGIFAYLFAISLFSAPFYAQSKLEGKKFIFIDFVHKIFKINGGLLFKYREVLRGFLIASTLHTLFNFFLKQNLFTETFILVITGLIYIIYLMRHKAGYLLLGRDKQSKSLMAPKDEEVILELLGMWINEEKYAEVEEICQRLLDRDPDNKIVQIFKAKADDKKKLKKAVYYLKALFSEKTPLDKDFEESVFERLKKDKK